MHGRRLIAAGLGIAALVVAPTAQATPDKSKAVCNQAENSHRGEYVIHDTDDPTPPAHLRGEAMEVGAPVHAAERSRALTLCVTESWGGGPF